MIREVLSRRLIVVFLALGFLLGQTFERTCAQEESEEQPYWYQPGHPINPAEARSVSTKAGFKVEKYYEIPSDYGSWTAIAIDEKGRLICAAQHQPGLYRLTPGSSTAGDDARPMIERLQGVAEEMGWCHGLLCAFDSLYVTVGEENETTEAGLYRLRDTNGDDQYDGKEKLLSIDTHGEHGAHNVVIGPNQQWLYMICGNGTPVPDSVETVLPTSTEGTDHLMPPGFESSQYTSAGFVLKFRPDGSEQTVVCGGLRNSFDLAFNEHGDLFTFDSDMEWDLGAPWYRPTRICHLVSGGEFGWRNDAAKWPDYFEDSCAPVLNIGPGSPTGVAFGYGSRFPSRYQQAMFVCDWTFATIYAVHLEPEGASYTATYEEFVGGSGLPVTDLTFGGDGAMYFIVGGRRLGSAVYRVRYEGKESTTIPPKGKLDPDVRRAREKRLALEAFHKVKASTAVGLALVNLGSDDRAIRFAARVALESQPAEVWRNQVFQSETPQLLGLLALARQGEMSDLLAIANTLVDTDFEGLDTQWKRLAFLRTLELCVARGNGETRERALAAIARPCQSFAKQSQNVQRELARLMCFLQEEDAVKTLLSHMESDQGTRPTLGKVGFERNAKYGESVKDILVAAPLVDRMHDAQMLLWIKEHWSPDQRKQYFHLMADAVQNSKGGYWYTEFWSRIRESALEQIPEPLRAEYASVKLEADSAEDVALPKPIGPGRKWTVAQVLDAAKASLRDRDFENGRKMYSAAACITCHRLGLGGKSLGPELTQVGQRFKIKDIVEATVEPSKAISDQYAVSIFLDVDGQTVTGRVLSRDENWIKLATNLQRPSETTRLAVDDIEEEHLSKVSTMPSGLLDNLNEDEVLDLLAYLVSAGDPAHPVFSGNNSDSR